jgi:hypothetical protein
MSEVRWFFNPLGITIGREVQAHVVLKKCFEARDHQRQPLGRAAVHDGR